MGALSSNGKGCISHPVIGVQHLADSPAASPDITLNLAPTFLTNARNNNWKLQGKHECPGKSGADQVQAGIAILPLWIPASLSMAAE